MNEIAETLGARLRAERERKGLSAQKAADDLHLDGWVIDALEGDDYARIGPSVYGKGHLKRYAELLGLPTSDILAAYEGRSAAPIAGTTMQASTLRMRASDSDEQDTPWGLIGGAAALALVVAGAFLGWKSWSARTTAAPATAVVAPTSNGAAAAASTVAGDEQPSAEAIPVTTSSNAVIPVTTSDTEPVEGVGKARLRLSFSADSWVDVHDAEGRRLFAGSGHANSVKTIAGDAPLKVYLGFASGVEVEVNSRVVAIGPQFITGDVARFDAGADAVLRRDSRASAAAAPRPRG